MVVGVIVISIWEKVRGYGGVGVGAGGYSGSKVVTLFKGEGCVCDVTATLPVGGSTLNQF